jgi:hypothetical protein
MAGIHGYAARKTRLTVIHVDSRYVFGLMDVGRSPYAIGQRVATGGTDSLDEVLESVHDYALDYLGDELEKVTVPFWIEELV